MNLFIEPPRVPGGVRVPAHGGAAAPHGGGAVTDGCRDRARGLDGLWDDGPAGDVPAGSAPAADGPMAGAPAVPPRAEPGIERSVSPDRSHGLDLDEPSPCGRGGSAARPGRLRAKRGFKIPDPMTAAQIQTTYGDELAYGRARERARMLGHIAWAVAFALGLPVLVLLVFFAAYLVTCILNGASPQETAELMGALLERMLGFAWEAAAVLAR